MSNFKQAHTVILNTFKKLENQFFKSFPNDLSYLKTNVCTFLLKNLLA